MENQHRGTSYISANTTDKPERMRMSCAFWFCGEEEKKNQCCMARYQVLEEEEEVEEVYC